MPPTPSFPSADVNPIRGVNKVCSSCNWGGVGRRGEALEEGAAPPHSSTSTLLSPTLLLSAAPKPGSGGVFLGEPGLCLCASSTLHGFPLPGHLSAGRGAGASFPHPQPSPLAEERVKVGFGGWRTEEGVGRRDRQPRGPGSGSGAAGEAEAEAKGGDLGPSSGWPCPGAVHSLSPTPLFLSLPSPSFISCTPQKVNQKGRKITN